MRTRRIFTDADREFIITKSAKEVAARFGISQTYAYSLKYKHSNKVTNSIIKSNIIRNSKGISLVINGNTKLQFDNRVKNVFVGLNSINVDY